MDRFPCRDVIRRFDENRSFERRSFFIILFYHERECNSSLELTNGINGLEASYELKKFVRGKRFSRKRYFRIFFIISFFFEFRFLRCNSSILYESYFFEMRIFFIISYFTMRERCRPRHLNCINRINVLETVDYEMDCKHFRETNERNVIRDANRTNGINVLKDFTD